MLLTGPPGSGKTHTVLSALEHAIAEQRASQVLLVVPTTSMARHLTHTLARRGWTIPGESIQTLADFVEGLTPAVVEPTPAIESYLLAKALAAADRPEFSRLAETPGLRAKLAASIAEFQAAGCDAATAQPFLRKPYQIAFGAVFREYEKLLGKHGYVPRTERLLLAAEEIRRKGLKPVREVYFDGFFHFSHGEKQLIEALGGAVETLIVTLPEGLEHPLGRLPVRRVPAIHRPVVRPAVVSAVSSQNEIEEIARLILEDGRPYRDFLVIVRSTEVYAALIQAVFERFGIPFRLRSPRPLAQHGAVRYLSGLLGAIAAGFPGAETLEVLRHPYSPIGLYGQTDTFDFRVRENLPGSGLPFLLEQTENLSRVVEFLERLNGLAAWAVDKIAPGEWAERCRSLRTDWLRLPEVRDGLAVTQALELRELARALQQFDQAADEAAELAALDNAEACSLADYLAALGEVLRHASLRLPDQRHNVVNVVSVFEARQWEIPVAFVCGLVERQFPRHYAQDLFFPDSDRLALQENGFALRTSLQREAEERFLYSIATTRATEKLVLSYPRRDERDQPLLRSFLLPVAAEQDRPAKAARVREQPSVFSVGKPASIRHPELLREVLTKHTSFSPSSLETYLQCPFQFFAKRTLRLKGPPDDPERRIDLMLIGTIIHRAIAVWSAARGRPIEQVLDEVLDETLVAKSIRRSFRTELLRYNLRTDLARFVSETLARPLGDPAEQQCEAEIRYAADDTEQIFITGRIDRYDVFGEKLGLVVDYKYSSDSRVKGIMNEHEQGARLQAPLYLLGLERNFGIRPAGMRFWGLRRKTSLMGWVAEGLFARDQMLDGDRSLSAAEFREMLDAALRKALEAIDEIRAGHIEVQPADQQFCRRFCDFRDVCRVEL